MCLAEIQKAFMGPYVNGHMELKGRFYVPFNPSELSIEEAIGVSDLSGVDGRERQRQRRDGNTVNLQRPTQDSLKGRSQGMTVLSVTLFYNTLNDLYQKEYEDVRDEIRKLYPYTNTSEMIEKGNKASPMGKSASSAAQNQVRQIYFFWGSIAVAGILTHMSVAYTMFAPDGKPVRAQVSLSIEGFYVGEETEAGNKAGADGGLKTAGSGKAMAAANLREGYIKGKNPRNIF